MSPAIAQAGVDPAVVEFSAGGRQQLVLTLTLALPGTGPASQSCSAAIHDYQSCIAQVLIIGRIVGMPPDLSVKDHPRPV